MITNNLPPNEKEKEKNWWMHLRPSCPLSSCSMSVNTREKDWSSSLNPSKLFVLKIKVNFFLLGILVNTVKYIFIVLLETSFIPAISCHLCVSCRHINSILLQNDKQVISAFTLNRTYNMLTNYKHHFYQVYVFSKTIKDIK